MLVVLAGVAYCGATVRLGERTFFAHVARIWTTEETQELVQGVKESGAPVVERIKRGVRAGIEAGMDEARREAPVDPPADAPGQPDGHPDGR